ncbi:hypothetical protein ACOMCU_01725 [Lysinibacillus sp. UGB7]|uniref:hypothetical protein n=1 Tax=Lysinibacillus sp. UGB7 TaxID=3411039 RepID=UPI003B779DC3
MNLRQKVKKAKRELAILKMKNTDNMCQVDMYLHFSKCSDLQKVIDFKKKPSRPFRFNEEVQINMEKLTAIKMIVDGTIISHKISPNGKPFTKQQVQDFTSIAIKSAIKAFGQNTFDKEPELDYFNRKRKVSYVLYLSSDRTKQKRYEHVALFTQEYGSDKLVQN